MPSSISRVIGTVLCVVTLAGAVGLTVQFPMDGAGAGVAAFQGSADLTGDDIPDIVVGAGPGSGQAGVFSGADLALLAAAPPFGPSFLGGIRVAAGDIDADGVTDVVTAMASAGGRVRAFSGATLAVVADFEPYGPGFTGGLSVALGDVDADGHADLIVGPASGAGPVQAYSGATGAVLLSGLPFGGDSGGVNVAAGDVDGDGRADIVVGQARGSVVSVFRGADLAPLGSGAPYGPLFTGGVHVAVGDVNGDGRGDVITAPASGAAPVRVYDVLSLAVIASGLPFGPAFDRGIRVAAADLDGDGHAEVITAPGPGAGPQVRVFSGADARVLADFLAFDPAFSGGVYVAAPAGARLRFSSPSHATFTVGDAGSFTVRTAGLPRATSITRSGALPSGVTFADNGDGTATLAGTPGPGSGGTYALTLTADNGTPQGATQAFVLRVEEAPGITSATSATFRVGQAGTFQVVTTGFPVSDVASIGALPVGVTFVDQGDGRALLSGTPAAGSAGTYPLTITANNGVGSAAVQSFTLTVESGPAFTSPAAVTFVAGTPQSFGVTTVGVPPVTSIARTGTLPAGLTYTDNGDGTATLGGTPSPGSGGTYPQTLTASNGVGAPAVQILVVTVQQPPQITSAATATFLAGTAGAFLVVSTGAPLPVLSFTGGLPGGVTFTDNGDGTATLGGTPAAGGIFPLTISASNGVGAPAVQAFTLTVQQPPAITSAASAAFSVGSAGSFLVTTAGEPAPAISVTGTLPTGVSFVDNGNGSATLSGVPAPGTGGVYPLTLSAANGVGAPAMQSFSLIVQASPVFTSAASTTFTVGTAGSFAVTASGAPAPTISATGTLPTGVTFTSATGTLGGAAGQTGTFDIQFTAANGVPPDATQDFTLTVACPVITVSATALPDGAFGAAYGPVTFTASGSTGSTLSWTATGLPSGLDIGLASGSVTGSPLTTVVGGAVTVTVTDEYGCRGSRMTTIDVRPVAADNSFINGVGNTQFVAGGTPPLTPHVFASGSVLANDAGPGALSAAVTTAASNGVVAMNADGTFVYTPNVGFAGPTDSFGYTLTDGNGVTDTATVTISLSGVVWFVNNTGAAGDGRSHNPFNSLASAGPASLAGQAIFVHTGAGTTPGSLVLKTSQTLWGQGAVFTLNGLTIPSAARPTLGGTVTLATGATVSSVAFSTGAAAAIDDPAGAVTGITIANGVVVATTTGTAVNLTNASGTFTFESISVNGASNAISLTGLTGAFSVTGTGAAGSGGTIQNITGDAVRLSGTNSLVSFSHMIFQDIGAMGGAIDTVSGDQAIHGELVNGGLALNGVTMRRLSDHAILGSQLASPTAATVWNGLSITNSLIEDSNRFHLATLGDGGNEAMVRVLGLRGTVSVTGSTLRRGNEPLDIVVTEGALALTVTTSSFQAYKEDISGGSQPTVGQHCVDVLVQGAATASVTVGDRVSDALGNTFLNCRVGSVRVVHDTAATGVVDAVIARNAFTVDDHSSPAGFDFFFPMGGVLARSLAAAGSSMNVLALGNTFTEVTNASGGVGQLTVSAEGGQFQARVQGNTFVRPGNAPWFIRAAENAAGRIELGANTVVGGFFSCPDPSCGGGYNAPGLRAIADVQRGGLLHLTLDGDHFAQHDTAFDPGNTVEIQANNVGAPSTVCAALRNNQSADGYALEQQAGTFNLYRWLSGATGTCTSGAPANCTTVLADNSNTGGAGNPLTTPPVVSVAGTITLSSVACQLPSGGIFQP